MDYVKHPLIRPESVESRLYQEELVGNASVKNSLIVLPTALGKTAIALMLGVIRLEKYGGSRILVLAPTKPLCMQHQKYFQKNMTLSGDSIIVLLGSIPPAKRAELWASPGVKIICATPQTVRNDIITKRADLTNVSLIVFDEAHRAIGSYAYVGIAKEYVKRAKNQLVLAMTASPGSNREHIKAVCDNLFVKNIEARDEKDASVAGYTQNIDVSYRKVQLPPEFLHVKELLITTLRSFLKGLKEKECLDSAATELANKRTLLDARKRILGKSPPDYSSIMAVAAGIKLLHLIELLETQGTYACNSFLERMRKDGTRSSKILFSMKDFSQAATEVQTLLKGGIDHPKLKALIDLLREENDNSKSQIIVFSHYREQVKKISRMLNDVGVSASEFLGQGEGFTQKTQKERINGFREGAFRVLCSTSVAEEGIDIPSVDLVVFYEPVPSAIRLIQRRGRTARKGTGRVVILIAAGSKDEAFYWMSRNREKKMRKSIDELRKELKRNDSGAGMEKSQQTLRAFEEFKELNETPAVRVIADSREAPSGLIEILAQRADVSLESIPVGDFIVSDRVVVERKTATDFASSMIDGRLFQQAAELKRNFERPIFVIEGGLLEGSRNVRPAALHGALASLVLDYSIPVIFTKDSSETAGVVEALARREQLECKRPVSVKGKKKAPTLRESAEQVVSGIPDVNVTLARRLLRNFGSVGGVFGAGSEELKSTKGIGDGIAQRIRKVVEYDYKEESESLEKGGEDGDDGEDGKKE